MTKINIAVYETAKEILVKLTAKRLEILEKRRITDQQRNGNYNSQFWDVESTYDEVLDKKLTEEVKGLTKLLENLNESFFNMTIIVKAASMCIVNENMRADDVRYADITKVLNELLATVAHTDDGLFVVKSYRKYGLSVESFLEGLSALYNANKGYFSI